MLVLLANSPHLHLHHFVPVVVHVSVCLLYFFQIFRLKLSVCPLIFFVFFASRGVQGEKYGSVEGQLIIVVSKLLVANPHSEHL